MPLMRRKAGKLCLTDKAPGSMVSYAVKRYLRMLRKMILPYNGFSCEIMRNENVTDRMEDAVVWVEIPVKTEI